MLSITQADFLRLVSFIHKNYGIDLSKKRQLIEGRLTNTIMTMGFKDFSSYVDHIMKHNDPKDIEVLLNKLTTNYTFFLREKAHFELFKDTIMPELVQKKKHNKVFSIWSAGCSSGQEPYTISMLMKEYLGRDFASWDTRILATDISQNVLMQAQRGEYDEEQLKDVPAKWKSDYFTKAGGTNKYRVTQEIRDNVIFRTFNLMDPIKFKLKFDVIFCRNVMIYFDQSTKDALVKRYFDATNDGGYLLIGHSETLNKENTPYKYLSPATYRKL